MLVAQQVPGRPPRSDVGVVGLGDEDPAEPGRGDLLRSKKCSTFMSSKSNARLPLAPLISMRMAFLRPVAKRVASKTPIAPPVEPGEEAAASSTVTAPRWVGVAVPDRPSGRSERALRDERVQIAATPRRPGRR